MLRPEVVSLNRREVVYMSVFSNGKQKYTPELIERVKAGEVAYGGCVIKHDRPFWQCVECLAIIHPKRGIVSV